VLSAGVVVVTRNRRDTLLRTLDRLCALPERPPIVVVDNGSVDGTAAAARRAHPDVRVIALEHNAAGGARVIGAEALDTPLVALSDDDSWWAPGALATASRLFQLHPRLGLLAARIVVGAEERLDPTCVAMRESPLPPDPDLPGPPVLGFLACAAIVRREAFLAAGGFEPRFGIGGEEQLLALDLAAAGWKLAYVDSVVAHHHPPGTGPQRGRRVTELRNDLWTAWLRRPLRSAVVKTAALTRAAITGGAALAPLHALAGLPWVIRERRVVPASVERAARRLEAPGPR
jgi:GT2 family glycosyltransferase